MTNSFRKRSLACACVLLSALPCAGVAQAVLPGLGEIRGRILDAVAGTPVSLVGVTLRGTGLSASTGRAGRFAIHSIPAGTYVVQARAPATSPSPTRGLW